MIMKGRIGLLPLQEVLTWNSSFLWPNKEIPGMGFSIYVGGNADPFISSSSKEDFGLFALVE